MNPGKTEGPLESFSQQIREYNERIDKLAAELSAGGAVWQRSA
jgi:hypothetical protein